MTTDSARVRRVVILLLLITGCVTYILSIHLPQYICEQRSRRVESNVSKLVRELDSPMACVRSQAAFDLQKVGSNGAPAVARLVELLKDRDDSVRWRSVAALGYIGKWDDRSIHAVARAFRDPNETVRLNTLFAIGYLSFSLTRDGKGFATQPDWTMPKEAMHVFLEALNDPSPLVLKKSLLHFSPDYLPGVDEEYRVEYIRRLRARSVDTQPPVRHLVMMTLWAILPVADIERDYPNAKGELEELAKLQDDIIPLMARRIAARLEGKKLPVILQMVDGTEQKYKGECDENRTGMNDQCFYYGELLEYRGDLEGARIYFDKDCRNSNGIGPGCEKLGEEAFLNGDRGKARKYFEIISRLYGTRSEALVRLGEMAESDSDPGAACQWFLLSCYFGNESGCTKGASCEAKDDVLAARDRKRSRHSATHVEAANSAHALSQRGAYAEAITLLEGATREGDELARAQLGEVYEQAGNLQKAEDVLSVGCKQLEALSCIRYGNLLALLGKAKEAQSAYERACYTDRVSCAEVLADFYSLAGRAEMARRYFDYLCNVAEGDRTENYCRHAQGQKSVPADVLQLESKCKQGDRDACSDAGKKFEDSLDYERALQLYKLECDVSDRFSSCQRYLFLLRRLNQWSKYDALVEARCPADVDACMALADRKRERNDVKGALEIYTELCRKHKISSSCLMLRRAAHDGLGESEKIVLFKELCEKWSEISSCVSVGLLQDAANRPEERVRYLNLALSGAQDACSKGRTKECAEAAMLMCALGRESEGRKSLDELCSKQELYCKASKECENALSLIRKEFQ